MLCRFKDLQPHGQQATVRVIAVDVEVADVSDEVGFALANGIEALAASMARALKPRGRRTETALLNWCEPDGRMRRTFERPKVR